MSLSRRRLLQIITGLGLLGASGYTLKLALWTGQLSFAEEQTLRALLAHLIPSDETPGILDIGGMEKIQLRARQERHYRRLIKAGCRWFERRARAHGNSAFNALTEDKANQLMQQAAQAQGDSLAYQFFHRLREDAMDHYYADATIWADAIKLPGLERPPQPFGYPDYQQAPTDRSS